MAARTPLSAPSLRLGADWRVTEASPGLSATFGRDELVGLRWDELVQEGPSADRLVDVKGTDVLITTVSGAMVTARAATDEDGVRVTFQSDSLGEGVSATLLIRAIDAADNSIVISDMSRPDQPIVYVNRGFIELSGYTREEAVGRNCRFLQQRADGTMDTEDRSQRLAIDAIRSGLDAGEMVSAVVLRNYRKDGTRFYNELFLTPVQDADGRATHYIGVQNDVTERVEAERQLEGRASQLSSLFDAMPVPLGILERDPSGSLRHVIGNAAARDAFGRVQTPLGGLGFGAEAQLQWQRAADQVSASSDPVRFQTSLGDERPFEVVLARVHLRDAPDHYFYVASDLADQRELSELLLNASSAQLRRVAQDIHDGVGQTLAGTSLLMSALSSSLARDQSAYAQDAHRLNGLMVQALDQLRRYTLGLDPLDLREADLVKGLARLADDTRALFDIDVVLTPTDADVRLPRLAVQDLYRIAQEAITNAVRHGGATHIALSVQRDGTSDVCVCVEDDGCGFDVDAPSEGLGMKSMSERALRHHGRLTFRPRAGGGIVAEVCVPLQAD